eukprot:gene3126-3594_t
MKPITSIAWSPTRNHSMAVLLKNSPIIKLFDLQHLPTEQSASFPAFPEEEMDATIMERCIQPSKSTLSSFCWHPSNENVILTASTTGNLNYVQIFERIALSWSSNSGIVWGCGRHMITCNETVDQDRKIEQDISTVMRERAILGYGEKSMMKDLHKLKEILNDPVLVKLWTWLKYTRKGRRFYGVKSIIKGEMNMAGKCEKGHPDDSSRIGSPIAASPLVSEERKLALQLCRWDFVGNSLNEHLKKLEQSEEYERAAAMAIFNNQMRLAINILSGRNYREVKSDNGPRNDLQAPDPSMNVVAMALSGYTIEKRSLWREMCASLSSQLKNPYLRGMFAFLTQEDENFNGVLGAFSGCVFRRDAFSGCILYRDGFSRCILYRDGFSGCILYRDGFSGYVFHRDGFSGYVFHRDGFSGCILYRDSFSGYVFI